MLPLPAHAASRLTRRATVVRCQRPALDAGWGAVGIEPVGDGLESQPLGTQDLDAGHDPLFGGIRLQGQPVIGHPVAEGHRAHPLALGLLVGHACRGTFPHQVALHLCGAGHDGQKEPAHVRARVDGLPAHVNQLQGHLGVVPLAGHGQAVGADAEQAVQLPGHHRAHLPALHQVQYLAPPDLAERPASTTAPGIGAWPRRRTAGSGACGTSARSPARRRTPTVACAPGRPGGRLCRPCGVPGGTTTSTPPGVTTMRLWTALVLDSASLNYATSAWRAATFCLSTFTSERSSSSEQPTRCQAERKQHAPGTGGITHRVL